MQGFPTQGVAEMYDVSSSFPCNALSWKTLHLLYVRRGYSQCFLQAGVQLGEDVPIQDLIAI